MAKARKSGKKRPVMKSKPSRRRRGSAPNPVPKPAKPRRKQKLLPFLKKDGSPRKNTVVTPYLTKTGQLNRRFKYPEGVKTPLDLYKRLSFPKVGKLGLGAIKGKPWLNRDGSVRKGTRISKWLTKTGKIRKNRKLPAGVKTVKGLYSYLQKKNFKPSQARKSGRAVSFSNSMFVWIFREYVTKNFKKWGKVYMGGKQISFERWNLYGDDYVQRITDPNDSPPSVYYEVVRLDDYRYLFF